MFHSIQVWWSNNNFQKSLLSLYHLGPGYWTRIARVFLEAFNSGYRVNAFFTLGLGCHLLPDAWTMETSIVLHCGNWILCSPWFPVFCPCSDAVCTTCAHVWTAKHWGTCQSGQHFGKCSLCSLSILTIHPFSFIHRLPLGISSAPRHSPQH